MKINLIVPEGIDEITITITKEGKASIKSTSPPIQPVVEEKVKEIHQKPDIVMGIDDDFKSMTF